MRDAEGHVTRETLGYDNLNRLTRAALGSTTKTVSYDAIGNVSQRSDVGSYGYSGCGGAHRVCAAGFYDFRYDANGNMLTGNGRSMTWTSYNYPQQITQGNSTESFLYTPERERVRRTSVKGAETTTTIYLNPRIDLGGAFEKTRTPGSLGYTEYTHHIYAGGQVIGSVATIGSNARTYYFHADHLGSLTAVTDVMGTVIDRLSYDAWGKRRHPNSGNDDTCSQLSGERSKRGFTLHEHLDNVDLVHMNGRIYDPLLGRFLSADPNVFYPENMQDFNRYSYVQNNPLSLVDSSGFMSRLDDNQLREVQYQDSIQIPIYINNGVYSFNSSGGSLYGNSITISYVNSAGVSTSSQTAGASNQHAGASVSVGNGTGANSGDVVRSGSAVGNVFRDYVPLVGGMLGGLADMGSGIVNMGLGVATLGLSNSFGRGLDQVGSGLGGATMGSLDLVGKAFSLPNTLFGSVIGGIGSPFGGEIGFANNAMEFRDSPLMDFFNPNGALTLGNAIIYGSQAYSTANHEVKHTYQGQFTGLAYIPLNIVGMALSVLSYPIESLRRFDPFHGRLNFMEGSPFRPYLYGGEL